MLNKRTKYLQVALNSSIDEANRIIRLLPVSERIILEAGTPLIKAYGTNAISSLVRLWGYMCFPKGLKPYVVADLKTMDRGATEVSIAANAGASAAIALGQAPIETLEAFVKACRDRKIDSMIDMMGVDQPVKVLRKLSRPPNVVLLHRGVDEETYNKSKPIPYIQINKVRSSFDVMISIAGGDSVREVQRAVFNGADIVVVWKDFYKASADTAKLAHEFLKEIK